MISMVRCKENVGVVKLTSAGECLHNCLDTIIHRLQCLEPLGHQGVSEPLVDRQHLLSVSQYPLLVRVGSIIVCWSMVDSGVEEHVLILWSTVLRTMWSRIGQHCQEWSILVLHLLDDV